MFSWRILVSVIFLLAKKLCYFSSFYLDNLTKIYLEPEFDKILFKNIFLSPPLAQHALAGQKFAVEK